MRVRNGLLLSILLLWLAVPAYGAELPVAQGEIGALVPEASDSFLEGFFVVAKACVATLDPALEEAAQICLKVATVVLLQLLVKGFGFSGSTKAMDLAAVLAVGGILLEPSAALIQLGQETVQTLSDYSKLLLPVMTGAMAAQGGRAASASLYALTAFLDSLISGALSGLILPVLYLYLGLSLANGAMGQPLLGKMADFCKWLMTWMLKIGLYIFTGFLTVTGVVSGSTDAAAMKAAKIAISGAVPVVGNILSDASEAVLVGAGVMRSAVGVYGLLSICGLFLSPFFRIGTQYLMLKATGGLCAGLGESSSSRLILDISGGMGMILAVTAVQTVLLLISTVCLMKGVG